MRTFWLDECTQCITTEKQNTIMSTLLLSEARGLCALTIFFTVVREYSRTISKIGRQIQAPLHLYMQHVTILM